MVFKPLPKKDTLFITGLRVFASILLYLLFWVVTTPLCFALLRKTNPVVRFLILSGFLSAIFYSLGFLSFWILLLPIICVELALVLTQKKVTRFTHQTLIIALCGAATFHFGIFALFDALYPKKLSLQIEDWFFRINDFWLRLIEQVGSNSKNYSFVELNWYDYIGYIPSIYFLSLIIGVFSCFWRHKILAKFKAPDFLFWFAIASFALGFLDWTKIFEYVSNGPSDWILNFKTCQIYFKNIFIVLSGLYFFQGLSVSSYLMEKFKIARFWQNLWYILIVLNLPIILVFMGLLDFLFEFRSFKEIK